MDPRKLNFDFAVWLMDSATGQTCVRCLDCGCNLVLVSNSKDKSRNSIMLPVTKPEFFSLVGAVLSGKLTEETPEETTKYQYGQLVLIKPDSAESDYEMYLEGMEDYVLHFTPEEIVSFFNGIRKKKKFTNGLLAGADFVNPVSREQEIKSFVRDVENGRLRERFNEPEETSKGVSRFRRRINPFIKAYENGTYDHLAA